MRPPSHPIWDTRLVLALMMVTLAPAIAHAAYRQPSTGEWAGWGVGFVLVFIVGTLFLATCFMLAYNFGRRRRSRRS